MEHDNPSGPCSCGAWHDEAEGIEAQCPDCQKYFRKAHKCVDKWTEFYINMAKEFAKMAKDPRLHVGAVIVTTDGILYPGFNGWEKGGTNEPDSLEPGMSGTVHAEANAILKFNPTIHKGSKMYMTHNPCIVCARMIVNTQAIAEVYFAEEYRDTRGVQILRERGIRCEKV